MQRAAHRRLRRLQGRRPTRPARRSSWCRAMSSSPRRPSACRCSATAIRVGEVAKLLAFGRSCFPSAPICVGAYSLGKAQRVIALIRQAGYDAADLSARRAGEHHPLLPAAAASSSATCEPVRGADKRELAGAITLCPPSALQDVWIAALSRSGAVLCLRLDAGAGARPPARRRIAAGDLRSRRLGRPHRHHRGHRRVGNLGHARPGGRAGALVRNRGLKARPLAIVGYGDEDEATASPRPQRAPGERHEPLRRTARPPRLRARPQQQAAADDGLSAHARPIRSAAMRWPR